jgi:starch-binding outer membrane protein, SusD/RagB family
MNRKISILITLTLILSNFSCTDLSEEVYSDIPFDSFFKTEEEVLMNAGRAYSKLQSYPEEFSLWTLTEMASDEMVAPGRDDGLVWDEGRWDQLHTHKIESNNKILTLAWEFVFKDGISACNEIIYETELSTLEFEGKDKILAEIKILRALYYYWAMDNWGNVPFSVDFTDQENPQQVDRAFLFDFVESEIKNNIDKLEEQPVPDIYGRVTKGMAYTLLAKLYLNAEEWIGTSKFEEAIAACDTVINLNAYRIEDDYFANFKAQNENSVENIFVIPNHSIYTKDNFYWYTLTLNDASRQSFDFVGQMWDEFIVEPGYLDKYAQEDIRRKSFLYGQQYDKSGNPIYLIEGAEKDTSWFIYTTTVENYRARKRWEGARFCKYEYQPNLEYYVNDMQNDFVLFRYADVLYTKLEALYRLGRAGEMLSDPELMKIRTRAGLAPYQLSDLNDGEFLNELGREFAMEGHRRQDQIRFGVWGNTWWNKPVSGPNAKLFPIPQSVLNTNSNLVQNPK